MKSLNYFKALSDETRIRLVHLLWHHELNVNEITAILKMGQSRISRHLKLLSECGLLSSRRDGLWIFYSVLSSGDGRKFIETINYLFEGDARLSDDLIQARIIIDERTREIKNFFNGIALSWDSAKKDILGDFDLNAAISSRVTRCNVAADLGCGTGDLLAAIKEKSLKIIGVDSSPAMLEMARKRFSHETQNIDLRLGELEHLPLSDGEADVAIVNMALHHLASPLDGIREAYRILGRKNLFLIADFDKHGNELLRTKHGDRWLGFEAGEIAEWLGLAGFRLIKTDTFPIANGLSICIYQSIKE